MKMPIKIEQALLAPCGVSCFACGAYLSEKTNCPGCRAPAEEHTRKSCMNCMKKKCAFRKGLSWCFECNRFPCSRMKDLSKRYMQNYDVDLVQNGLDARKDMDAFLQAQQKRFTCPLCGGIIDQHHRICSECKSGVIANCLTRKERQDEVL